MMRLFFFTDHDFLLSSSPRKISELSFAKNLCRLGGWLVNVKGKVGDTGLLLTL